jgi:PAS domain S-box-containing protein
VVGTLPDARPHSKPLPLATAKEDNCPVPDGLDVRPRLIAPVALVLGLAIAGFLGARLLGERDARRDSEHRAEVAATQIRGRLVDGSLLADSLGRLIAGTGITSEEFASNASRWLSPAGFPAAAWVEHVPASGRAAYERRIGQPIVTQDLRRRILPVGARPSYLPATLVSGVPPVAVPGIDLGGEPGMASALARASARRDVAATPLETLQEGGKGLFLVGFAPRTAGARVERGFVVVFVSDLSLRAAASGTPTVQLTAGGAPTGEHRDAATVRRSFTEAGQRFDVILPRGSAHGPAAVLPWIILGAGVLLAALAGALGVAGARRAQATADVDRFFVLSADLIVVAGFDGLWKRVNPAFERLLGYTEDEVLGRPCLDFIHPDDRERSELAAADVVGGTTRLAVDNRMVCKDGSHRWIEWSSTPVPSEGLIHGVGRDVTERRQVASELRRLAGEQAALRRVATLVAREASQAEIFTAIAEAIGQLLGTEEIRMERYEDDRNAVVVASAGEARGVLPLGSRLRLGGDNAASRVFRTGQPARIDDYGKATGEIAEAVGPIGIRSVVATPILVEGRLWGAMVTGTTQDEPLPPETETRLGQFTDLMATAIANTESRAQVERLAEEQAALRRVATLVAERAAPEAVFDAVAGQLEGLLDADQVALDRFEPGDEVTLLAYRGPPTPRLEIGARYSSEGESVTAVVRRTERPARFEQYEGADGAIADVSRSIGVRSAVGAPLVLEGRVWGMIVAAWAGEQSPPADTEERMAQFAGLLATAIANADTRAELIASRARLVAASDETRRRFERDLHDGVQQRLVGLALELRGAEANIRAEQPALAGELARLSESLNGALEDLRELSRGIHPAILTEGGLAPALKALARRSGVPIALDVTVGRRLAESVEVAAYYVVSEALANAAKHAQASAAEVQVDARDGVLDLRIRDDGVGGADPARGSGLTGLRDRVEALGGTIAITSPAGEGTSLHVALPIADSDPRIRMDLPAAQA